MLVELVTCNTLAPLLSEHNSPKKQFCPILITDFVDFVIFYCKDFYKFYVVLDTRWSLWGMSKLFHVLNSLFILFPTKIVNFVTLNWIAKKENVQKTYRCAMHNWLKRILTAHQTRMLNTRPSKHRWLWCRRRVATMHWYLTFAWPLSGVLWHLHY